MGKAANLVLAENLRAIKSIAAVGAPTGNLHVAKAAKIGEGTVARARRGDGNTTVANLDALAKYYKREAWELLCPSFQPGTKLFALTEAAIDAEVHRRMIEIVQLKATMEVSDEKARAGPSAAYPFGALQDARPEPPPSKTRLTAKSPSGHKGPRGKN